MAPNNTTEATTVTIPPPATRAERSDVQPVTPGPTDEQKRLPLLGPPDVPIWKRLFLIDWVVCVTLLIVMYMIQLNVNPYCREFRWGDDNLRQPHNTDTFPNYSVWLFAVLPGIVMVGTNALFPMGGMGSTLLLELNALILLQVRAACLSSMLTTPLRHYAGVLRPDYIQRLLDEGFTPPDDLDALVKVCGDSHQLKQARESFPSGHTTLTLSGVVPLAMYLVYRTGAMRRSSFTLLLLSSLALIPALMCAISRIRDNAHHPADVGFGITIGVFAAWVAWHITMVQVPYWARKSQNIRSDYRPRWQHVSEDFTRMKSKLYPEVDPTVKEPVGHEPNEV